MSLLYHRRLPPVPPPRPLPVLDEREPPPEEKPPEEKPPELYPPREVPVLTVLVVLFVVVVLRLLWALERVPESVEVRCDEDTFPRLELVLLGRE